jgi:hypothetical protein
MVNSSWQYQADKNDRASNGMFVQKGILTPLAKKEQACVICLSGRQFDTCNKQLAAAANSLSCKQIRCRIKPTPCPWLAG